MASCDQPFPSYGDFSRINCARISRQSVRHETNRRIKKLLQINSIKETLSLLPKVVVDNLLLIHTWSGCDAVCATYSHGKTKLLNVFECNLESIFEIWNIYNHPLWTIEEVSRTALNYSGIFMVSIIHSFLLLILKLNSMVWNVILSIWKKKKNHWDCLATGRETICNCANSYIIIVRVMGVILLNQRNVSCSKCRVFCKQKRLGELGNLFVNSRKFVVNCSFLTFSGFFFRKCYSRNFM